MNFSCTSNILGSKILLYDKQLAEMTTINWFGDLKLPVEWKAEGAGMRIFDICMDSSKKRDLSMQKSISMLRYIWKEHFLLFRIKSPKKVLLVFCGVLRAWRMSENQSAYKSDKKFPKLWYCIFCISKIGTKISSRIHHSSAAREGKNCKSGLCISYWTRSSA